MEYSSVGVPVLSHSLPSIHSCFAFLVSGAWRVSSIRRSVGFVDTSFFLSRRGKVIIFHKHSICYQCIDYILVNPVLKSTLI